MASCRVEARLVVALLIGVVPGCRCASTRGQNDSPDAGVSATNPSASASMGSAIADEDPDPIGPDGAPVALPMGDAGNRFRDAGPNVDPDFEGPADPACTGAEVAFASAIIDARCAIGSARAKKLRAHLERDGGAAALHEEARVAEGGRVALRLVNTGRTSVTLPLSFHGKVPAFTALAEDERHTIYELEAPQLELRDPGQGNRAHFARIVLVPGGAAVATVAISPTIARVLARGSTDGCKDGGAASGSGEPCNLTKLPKGRYILHIGQLLTDVEAGAPAQVTWDLP
jgi:hypothetical protein